MPYELSQLPGEAAPKDLIGTWSRVESLYRDQDSLNRSIADSGITLANDKDKKRYANMGYLSVATGIKAEKLVPQYDMIRDAFADQVMGVSVENDDAFYGLIQQKFAKERARRGLDEEIGMNLLEKAVTGGEFNESWGTTRKEFSTKDGWDKSLDESGVYEANARNQWNYFIDNAERLAPYVEKVETAWAQSGGFSGDFDKLAKEMADLPDDDIRLIMSIAAARQRKTQAVTDQATTGGARKILARFPGSYPLVKNEDGSQSNVLLGSFEIDGRNYVIPTMEGGKRLSEEEAVKFAIDQGLEKYPSFKTAKEADAWARKNHANVSEQGIVLGGNEATPFSIGLLKGAITAGRSSGQILTSAGDSVRPYMKMFPYWLDTTNPDTRVREGKIKRELQRFATGEFDPLKADSYFGNKMREAAGMVPFMLAASNYISMPVAYAAVKEDTKNQLIDEGLDADTANKLSWAAAPVIAGIDYVSSKTALAGKFLPGLKPLEKTTIKSLAARFGTRLAFAEGAGVTEQFAREMTAPVIQELWGKFDEAAGNPDLSARAKEYWKHSPDLMMALLPLMAWGAGVKTKNDANLAYSIRELRKPLEALGYRPEDINAAIAAAQQNRGALNQAIRDGWDRADPKSPQAIAARDEIVAQLESGKIPEGYNVAFNDKKNLVVTRNDGSVVSEAATPQEARKAAFDDFEARNAPKPQEKTKEQEAQDFYDLRKQYEQATQERTAAVKAGEKDKANAAEDRQIEIQTKMEDIKNRVFDAHEPPKPEPKPEPVTPEQAIQEPRSAPETDSVPVIPAKVALNKREIALHREAMDLQGLTPPERERQAAVMNAVKLEGSQSGAPAIAKTILENNYVPNAKEEAQMLLYVAERENGLEAVLSQASRAFKEGNNEHGKGLMKLAETLRDEIDLIHQASYRGGTRLGRALAFRKILLDRKSYDIVPLLRSAEEYKGAKLTDAETLRFTEMAKKHLELEARIAELEQALSAKIAEQARADGEEFVNEGVRKRSAAAKSKAKADREGFKRELAKLGYRLNDITNGIGLSYDAANLVSKIAKTYIEEGAASLSEVIGKLKADIPDITDNDIYNALGRRIKKAVVKIENEAKIRERELRKQAKLWGDVHDLLNKIPTETKELAGDSKQVGALREVVKKLRQQSALAIEDAKQLERAQGKLQELQDQLAGGFRYIKEGEKRRETPVQIAEVKKQVRELEQLMRTEDAIADLKEQLRTGDFRLSEPEKRIITNAELAKKLVEKRQLQQKVREELDKIRPHTIPERIVDVLLSPRALQSTLDISAVGRQGLILGVRNVFSRRLGVDTARAIGSSVRSVFSQHNADEIAVAIERHVNYSDSVMAGLHYSETHGKPLKREEDFMTNFAEKIPVVRASNRAMTTYLNLLRLEAYNRMLEANPSATFEQRKGFATWINYATGRGDLGKFAGATRELNVLFYAPRFAISRYQVLWAPVKYWKEPVVRKEIAKDLGAFFAFTATTMTLATLAGASVDWDPQSADFWKIKVGNTRYDVMGGMQQPMRLIALTFSGGFHRDERYGDPWEQAFSFARYKLNPAVTLPIELYSGKDFRGQPVEVQETLARAVTPLILQDTYDAITTSPEQTIPATIASGLGVSVSSYEKKQRGKKKSPQPR